MNEAETRAEHIDQACTRLAVAWLRAVSFI
jgi:hypothetical protein